jgi:hypothetical protein
MEYPPQDDSSQFKQCPACGQMMEIWAQVCTQCLYEWSSSQKRVRLSFGGFIGKLKLYNLLCIAIIILHLTPLQRILYFLINPFIVFYGLFYIFAAIGSASIFQFAIGIIGLIFNNKKSTRFTYSVSVMIGGGLFTYFLWKIYVSH